LVKIRVKNKKSGNQEIWRNLGNLLKIWKVPNPETIRNIENNFYWEHFKES